MKKFFISFLFLISLISFAQDNNIIDLILKDTSCVFSTKDDIWNTDENTHLPVINNTITVFISNKSKTPYLIILDTSFVEIYNEFAAKNNKITFNHKTRLNTIVKDSNDSIIVPESMLIQYDTLGMDPHTEKIYFSYKKEGLGKTFGQFCMEWDLLHYQIIIKPYSTLTFQTKMPIPQIGWSPDLYYDISMDKLYSLQLLLTQKKDHVKKSLNKSQSKKLKKEGIKIFDGHVLSNRINIKYQPIKN